MCRTDGEREVGLKRAPSTTVTAISYCGCRKGIKPLKSASGEVVAEYVQRGRVEIFVTIEEYRAKERTVRLDHGLLKGYLEAYSAAAALLHSQAEPDLDTLLAFPDVLTVEEVEVDVESAGPSSRRLCGRRSPG